MINLSDIQFNAIRARGKGGQNVNKLSTGMHLRFDIRVSSLSAEDKKKLLRLSDVRLSKDGVIVIKADRFRTQERNRTDGIKRLCTLIINALKESKVRKATTLPRAKIAKRLELKSQRATLIQNRKKVRF